MRKMIVVLFLAAAGCRNSGTANGTTDSTNTPQVVSYDTVPEVRTTISSAPVAEYSEPIPDELNNWKFAVAVYETRQTFHYTIRLQGKELRISDSLIIPNFGIQPKIGIRKGSEPLSCVIGFLNKKGEFMDYIGASFKNEQLHVKKLKHYAVSVFKTPVKGS